MPDDKTKRGEPDRSKINLSEDYEVRYWTKTLGISREHLQELVRRYGNSVEEVRKHAKKAA